MTEFRFFRFTIFYGINLQNYAEHMEHMSLSSKSANIELLFVINFKSFRPEGDHYSKKRDFIKFKRI